MGDRNKWNHSLTEDDLWSSVHSSAPLSHAAIFARELGIPAVVGCGTATAILRTEDRVCVDGGRGVVEVLPDG